MNPEIIIALGSLCKLAGAWLHSTAAKQNNSPEAAKAEQLAGITMDAVSDAALTGTTGVGLAMAAVTTLISAFAKGASAPATTEKPTVTTV